MAPVQYSRCSECLAPLPPGHHLCPNFQNLSSVKMADSHTIGYQPGPDRNTPDPRDWPKWFNAVR